MGIFHKRVFFWVLGFSCLFLGCEKEEDISPSDLFVKFYGDSRLEQAHDLLLLDDGGFLLIGSTNSPLFLEGTGDASALERDYYITFVDAGGNERQTVVVNQDRRIGLPTDIQTESTDTPSQAILTKDGHVLIIGTSEYNRRRDPSDLTSDIIRQSDMYLVKISVSDGEVKYDSLYDFGNLTDDFGNSVAEISDGYFLWGNTEGLTSSDASDFYLVKVEKETGAFIFKKRYDGRENGSDIGVRIHAFGGSSRRPVLMGYTSAGPSSRASGIDIYVARTDEAGEVSLEDYIGEPARDEIPTQMRPVGDLSSSRVEFVITGTSIQGGESSPFLSSISVGENVSLSFSDVSERFITYMDLSGVNRDANDFAFVDNGYWMVGRLQQYVENNVSRNSEMLLMRTNIFGSQRRSFGVSEIGGVNYGGVEDDTFVRILRLESGHLVLLGTLGFEGGSTMMCLIKANAQGELKQ